MSKKREYDGRDGNGYQPKEQPDSGKFPIPPGPEDGGPAFPWNYRPIIGYKANFDIGQNGHYEDSGIVGDPVYGEPVQITGMSLRDWFVGQALIGLATSLPSVPEDIIAAKAESYAEAILKERKK